MKIFSVRNAKNTVLFLCLLIGISSFACDMSQFSGKVIETKDSSSRQSETLTPYEPTVTATTAYKETRSWVSIGLSGVQINAFAINPKNHNNIFAATKEGLYSTADGGENWLLSSDQLKNWFSTVAFDPRDPNFLYASGGLRGFRSENGGVTWKTIISEGHINYFAFDMNNPQIIFGAGLNQALKSMDGGLSFSLLSKGLDFEQGSQVDFSAIVINPNDSSQIWMGGRAGPYFSSDAGESWALMADGMMITMGNVDGPIPDWVTTMVYDPLIPGQVLAGTYSQIIYVRQPDATRWQMLKAFQDIGNISAILFDYTSRQFIYAAVQTVGVVYSLDDGLHWFPLNKGLSSRAISDLEMDPDDPSVLYVSTYDQGIFRLVP
jgi:hypothetical protein